LDGVRDLRQNRLSILRHETVLDPVAPIAPRSRVFDDLPRPTLHPLPSAAFLFRLRLGFREECGDGRIVGLRIERQAGSALRRDKLKIGQRRTRFVNLLGAEVPMEKICCMAGEVPTKSPSTPRKLRSRSSSSVFCKASLVANRAFQKGLEGARFHRLRQEPELGVAEISSRTAPVKAYHLKQSAIWTELCGQPAACGTWATPPANLLMVSICGR
jgi:hypothetical protein